MPRLRRATADAGVRAHLCPMCGAQLPKGKRHLVISDCLGAIEARLAVVDATARLLLATRLVQDGHAATLREALPITHEVDRLRAIYDVPA